MNRLEALKQRGFTKACEEVSVDDIEILNWNKEQIKKDAALKASINSRYLFLIPFGAWLSKVEKVNVDDLDDRDLSILFDKYCLYYIYSLTEKNCERRNRNYVDVVSYCEREKYRLTHDVKIKTLKFVPLYDTVNMDLILNNGFHTDTSIDAVLNARLMAQQFKTDK